jgi:hypothetical protein
MLKYFALFLMTLDHFIIVFCPGLLQYRVITGFGFAFFAYMVANGFCYTSNVWKYALKIFIAAVFAQPFFHILVVDPRLNDLFTILFGLLFLIAYKRFGLIVFSFMILGVLFNIFHVYILFIPMFYFFRTDDKKLFAALFMFHCCLYLIGSFSLLSFLMSCLLLPIIRACENYHFHIKLPRHFFYAYYPFHLCFFFITSYFLSK